MFSNTLKIEFILSPSTSINKCAVSSSSTIIVFCEYSTANKRASLSINSSAHGTMPLLKIIETDLHASSADLNGISIVALFGGRAINLKTILVITASVPSLPTIKSVKLYPVAFFKTFAPVQIIEPSASTTSRFKT